MSKELKIIISKGVDVGLLQKMAKLGKNHHAYNSLVDITSKDLTEEEYNYLINKVVDIS